MSKIIHVVKTYFPESQGGIEEVVKQVLSVSVSKGFECEVITLSTSHTDVIIVDGIKVYRFKYDLNFMSTPMIFSKKVINNMLNIINNADIVHYHYPWPFMDYLNKYINKNLKRITTYHSDALSDCCMKIVENVYNKIINVNFLTSQDIIVATSHNYVESSKYLRKYQEKIKIIPLGLNDRKIEDTICSYNNFFTESYIFFVGVLRHYKGLSYLIESAKKIGNTKIIIAGIGPEEKMLKEKVINENITNVVFLGKISNDEKYQLIKHSKAVVLPSTKRSEAFGVTLLEALMLGKPIISTELKTGTSFVNKHNYTGFVVQPENSDDLAEGILKILDHNLNSEMSKNSRKYFLNNFESIKTNLLYTDIYFELLEKK